MKILIRLTTQSFFAVLQKYKKKKYAKTPTSQNKYNNLFVILNNKKARGRKIDENKPKQSSKIFFRASVFRILLTQF